MTLGRRPWDPGGEGAWTKIDTSQDSLSIDKPSVSHWILMDAETQDERHMKFGLTFMSLIFPDQGNEEHENSETYSIEVRGDIKGRAHFL
ncbi:unnamed protein product [Aspergillus oryzae var. brunneus]|uniref:Unnamed protein product n=2 Tax=Aspergillus oryzae TaxID=5062 RepID=A0AAN4YSV8_ASPOZ|nr:unnamed protein product [Aspergillus oryzae]GMG32501.1 unnamed protein product [Aspergillus oryzae]GMG45746.1 unnamed protein product [Aspergillus oryzae var. brunneus]